MFYFPDGLPDCQDPDCCPSVECSGSQLCMSPPDPGDILAKLNVSSKVPNSFWDRVRFLVESGKIQKYADVKSIDKRLKLSPISLFAPF